LPNSKNVNITTTFDIIQEIQMYNQYAKEMTMKNAKESRKALLDWVNEEGEVTLVEIRERIQKEGWWFGPSLDFAGYLFSIEAKGLLKVDLDAGKVISKQADLFN
jgi:hypothetical protein